MNAPKWTRTIVVVESGKIRQSFKSHMEYWSGVLNFQSSPRGEGIPATHTHTALACPPIFWAMESF